MPKIRSILSSLRAIIPRALGVCRVGGRAVFVPRALAGETWEIKLVKVGSSAVYGRGEKLLVPSPARTAPDCPVFGKCGGCDLWHMSYEEELGFKLSRVNDAFRHIGGLDFQVTEIVGADNTTGYRNKAIYAVAANALGPVTPRRALSNFSIASSWGITPRYSVVQFSRTT